MLNGGDSNTASFPFGRAVEQHRVATELGIWLFLATEVLFFGGLFMLYIVYRWAYPAAFDEAVRHARIAFGTINAVILLTSSFTLGLSAKSAPSNPRLGNRLLLATVAFGFAFLIVKAIEYWLDIKDGLVPGGHFAIKSPQAQIFWALYWLATGVHALHVASGVGILLVLHRLIARRFIVPGRSQALHVGTLYWHLVDLMWIFLYPLLYLIGRST